MSVKSDKTFEEIVERLIALFRPQADNDADAIEQPSSQPASMPAPTNLSPASSDEDTP